MDRSTENTVALAAYERLRDSTPQATSMSLPLAIHYRLDRLARLARDVTATRAEIVGMLIAEAALDAEDLEHRVIAYRKLKVGDVAPPDSRDEGSNMYLFPTAKQGRPRKSDVG